MVSKLLRQKAFFAAIVIVFFIIVAVNKLTNLSILDVCRGPDKSMDQLPSDKDLRHERDKSKSKSHTEAATGGVLRNFTKFTEKHLYQSLIYIFFCGFCEISKNTFLHKTYRGGCLCLIKFIIEKQQLFLSINLVVYIPSARLFFLSDGHDN